MNPQPKILYIITMADGAGAQKYVLDMAEHFHGAIAAGTEKDDLFIKARALGIQTFPLKYLRRNINPWFDLRAFFEILSVIKKYNPQIIHTNSSKAGILGSVAGKLSGKKVVFTAHGLFFYQNTKPSVSKIYTIIERAASLFRDQIIVVSEFDRQQVLLHKLIEPDRLTKIYYGIKPINFLSRSEARAVLKLEKFIIGSIAQYYPRKGLIDLILAFSHLPANLQYNSQLILIGDGPQKAELEELISVLNLNKKITLVGYLNNAAIYLKAFDIFVLPSYNEGYPYVLMEATQAQLPIIATDIGGNKEIINQTDLFLPGDVSDLSKKIQEKINQNLQPRHETSLQFNIQQMFDSTQEIYRKLLR